ncbi:hypothetical protein [Vaginella massiliensis]|nr:hypothetical protein [Vaginella massiliensis]
MPIKSANRAKEKEAVSNANLSYFDCLGVEVLTLRRTLADWLDKN